MRLLSLYLLTCNHHMSEGIYVIPKAYMTEDLGWTTERTEAALTALREDGFAKYDERTRVVLMPNAIRYQPPVGPKQVKGAANHLSLIPQCDLLQEFLCICDTVCPDLSILYRNSIETPPIPLALSSSSNSTSKKSSLPKKLSAAKDDDWEARAEAVLTATKHPSLYRDLAGVMAEANATGKVSLRRVVTTLYEPLLAVESNGVGAEAFEYGLRAALAKPAANVNYVKKAAQNAPAGYVPKSGSAQADRLARIAAEMDWED